jgi:N-methylhydantoinase B
MQVLRTHLEAIAEEAFRTIERTAISPIVTESLDAGVALTDAEGRLLSGGGRLQLHYGAAAQAVQTVLKVHGDTVAPGDVFFGNDPHSGIAVHPQDVMVVQPIFVGADLAGWVANSAHLMDLGGMSFGSWAPKAVECYQEAIRMPAVRLFRQGVEQSDVWNILLNNVRLPVMDEMDLRGLVAGCHVARSKLVSLIEAKGGLSWFQTEMAAMRELTESVLRRRIGDIADGIYRMSSWAEWQTTEHDAEQYFIPCSLEVTGDRLIFDFEGVAPQCPHYINSRPWILKSLLAPEVWNRLGQDLPLNQAALDVLELRCPPKSLLNSEPPAPIGAAHQDSSNLASILAISCLNHAFAASGQGAARKYLSAQSAITATATQVWRGVLPDGETDAVMMLDGICTGSYAGDDRDGNDASPYLIARSGWMEIAQVEVLESWHGVRFIEKGIRPGSGGAGRYRAGAGLRVTFEPHRTDQLTGVMYAKRPNLPFLGVAGGMPGATTALTIRHSDGSIEAVPPKAEGVVLAAGDTFRFDCASGGGWGDPLDRDPAAVMADVRSGRLSLEDAAEVYGMVLDAGGEPDNAAVQENRDRLRLARLTQAAPAQRLLAAEDVPDTAAGYERPLYPGVVSRSGYAFAEQSNAPLACAPNHWTDGCPVLTTRMPSRLARDIMVDMYLDPATGRSLAVDCRFDGSPRSFDIFPKHWTDAVAAVGS